MFDAVFTDVVWSDTDVPAAITDQVLRRTPGFLGWQQERWPHRCHDAAAFHSRVGAVDLASLPDTLEATREERQRCRWSDFETDVRSRNADGQPMAYLFRCLDGCGHLAYSDFT